MNEAIRSDRLVLRIEPNMKEEWAMRAAAEGRSLSNWLVWLVEKCKDQTKPQ